MTHRIRFSPKPILAAGVLAATLVTAGCAGRGGDNEDVAYVARDVESLYNEAKRRLDRGNTQLAAALFDEVERQHPYRSEEHTSELQSLMRISYAVFCLKKKTTI